MWRPWGHSGDTAWDVGTLGTLWGQDLGWSHLSVAHRGHQQGGDRSLCVLVPTSQREKGIFLTPHKTSGRGRWWLGGTDGDRMVTRSCAGCRDGISAPGIPSGSAFPPFLPRSHARFRSFPGTFPNPRSAPGRSHRARTGQVWTLRYLPGATCAPVPVPVCSARSLPATRGR